MKRPYVKINIFVVTALISWLFFPSISPAVERAPRIDDREIVERLTRLEEGQKAMSNSLQAAIRANTDAIKQLREDVNTQTKQLRKDMNTQTKQLREDMNTQTKQLREDMNTQFGRIDSQFDRIDSQFNRMSAIFTALVVSIIGFAIWDRRTMIRPFENKVKDIETEIVQNRNKLHSLIETLRELSKTDEKVAKVLKSFHLL